MKKIINVLNKNIKRMVSFFLCAVIMLSCSGICAVANTEKTINFISVEFSKTFMYEGNTEENVVEVNPNSLSEFVNFKGYNVSSLISSYRVHYSDGSFTTHSMFYDQNTFFRVISGQNDAAWGVGMHQVRVVLLQGGSNILAETRFNIEVREHPIKEFSCFATKDLIEGKTEQRAYWDDSVGQQKFFDVYSIHSSEPLFTVTQSNGTVSTLTSQQIYQMFGEYPQFIDDQRQDNIWGLGSHTVTASVMGKTCDFKVNVIENPIRSISAQYHGVLYAGTNFEVYSLNDRYLEYIITFADGRVESYYANEICAVYGDATTPIRYSASITAIDLNEESSWEAGEHQFNINLYGRQTILTVNVVDPDIKEISAKATRFLVADWHKSSYDGGINWFLPADYAAPEITVTYLDGTTEVMSYSEAQYKYPSNPPTVFMYDSSIEGIGTRKAALYMFGKSCEFDIEVKENPVADISAVTTKPIYKDFRGFISLVLDGGLEITVNFNDGSSFTGNPNDMITNFNAYPNEKSFEAQEPVLGATNIMPMTLLGKDFEVEYQYIEEPIKVQKITAELVNGAKLYESHNKYDLTIYNYSHLVLVTLHFSDGTTYTDYLSEINDYINNISPYSVDVFDGQYGEPWGVGKHSFEIQFKDVFTQLEIEVVENPYESAVISGTDSLKVELTRYDGTVETYNAYRFVGESYYSTKGILYTDKGNFYVTFKHAGGATPDYSKIYSLEIAGVLSNGLENHEWLEQQMKLRTSGEVPQIYVGTTSAALRDMATSDSDFQNDMADRVSAYISAENISNAISDSEVSLMQNAAESNRLQVIGDNVLDLSLIKLVDSTKTKLTEVEDEVEITLTIPEAERGKDSYSIIHIHNGRAVILEDIDTDSDTVTFKTSQFSTFALATGKSILDGDVNGDGKVDTKDLAAIRKIILSGKGSADINKDGNTDICDLVYLKALIA